MADEPTLDHDDFSDIEAMLRDLDVADLDQAAPPADVWAGIESELRAEWAGAAPETAVVSLAERRSRRVGRMLAIAAAAALVVAGAVVLAQRRGDDTTVVASARLTWDATAFDPLGADAAATAELVRGDDGYEIVLTDTTLPERLDEDADLELWLIDVRDDGSLDIQPVALVDGAAPGSYEVPAGLDPTGYRFVDISIEPRDGDALHSGRSILRGELQA